MKRSDLRSSVFLAFPLLLGAFTPFDRGESVVQGRIVKSGDHYMLLTREGTNSEARIRLAGTIPSGVRDSVGARGTLKLRFTEPSRGPAAEASVISVEALNDPFTEPEPARNDAKNGN